MLASECVRLFKDWLRSINGLEREIKLQAGPGLELTDPLNPVFLGDSDFAPVDPELLEQTGVSLTPEGNAHQAEFTSDNRFVIATDEDFAPYRVGESRRSRSPQARCLYALAASGLLVPLAARRLFDAFSLRP